ncbi:Uncharacterised protein [Serratia fonticola]|uniref:Uncharacterized protein n=1 Tax=Serratia fonticola TaxID=47917 RepID=A0A4V6Z294_SERFO|nr:Uncharacterised protein [Serratia fonticola]
MAIITHQISPSCAELTSNSTQIWLLKDYALSNFFSRLFHACQQDFYVLQANRWVQQR